MLPIKEVPTEARNIIMRDWTWDKVIRCLGMSSKKKRSGVLVCRCVFHFERKPSLWLRPHGEYICYGCKNHGDMFDFLAYMLNAHDTAELRFKLTLLQSVVDVPGQLYFPFHESWRGGRRMFPSRMV